MAKKGLSFPDFERQVHRFLAEWEEVGATDQEKRHQMITAAKMHLALLDRSFSTSRNAEIRHRIGVLRDKLTPFIELATELVKRNQAPLRGQSDRILRPKQQRTD